ncbi:MAG: hypothetical protein HZC36_03070 [Armatimonadetes bacterium]|nr:hypothetical protein [Armatimonadota bacterium]
MSSDRWLQSYSGVRATVGPGPNVKREDAVFAFRHAYCYAISRLQANPSERARMVLARDPRPTGEALLREQAAGMASAFRDLGVELDLINLGVVTTPIWQHSVRVFEAHGGVMVTASHNPVDDNGWKYATGVETHALDPAPPGALLSASEMGSLIRAANAFRPQAAVTSFSPSVNEAERESAVQKYVDFVQDSYFANTEGAKVVLDPNGGAATVVCRRVFEALGVEPIVLNEEVGKPAHDVDVEQVRADGKHVLHDLAERVQAEEALFGLAYDFDADRGNLTFVDGEGKAQIPSPQAAAAINTAIALAVHRRSGDARPAAVVASDATSYRVHQIARAFGASVHEVETGEINVVTRMRDLERQGLRAVVGVEGPNGGTIFAGTTCRDGSLVGAGAILASADAELRRIISSALTHDESMGPGLSGFIADLPRQRTVAAKGQVQEEWWPMIDRLEQEFPSAFASELSKDWTGFEFLYSYTRHVGPERPEGKLCGWKVRLVKESADGGERRRLGEYQLETAATDEGKGIEREGFLWIRGSKTEAGLLRVVGDGPDEAAAQAILQLGLSMLR